jgi:hypothetical protein
MRHETCPGCGLELPAVDAPTHAYLGASPACWTLYGEVLAREYSSPELAVVHQLTVDAYAAQHPGAPERRTVQSLALHLVTLGLWVEDGADPRRGPSLHARLAARGGYTWLEPPRPNGRLTVADVRRAAGAAEHRSAVDAWARDVWRAWEPHHATMRAWAEERLGP